MAVCISMHAENEGSHFYLNHLTMEDKTRTQASPRKISLLLMRLMLGHLPASGLVDTLGNEVSREGCFEGTLVLERVVALSVGHAEGGRRGAREQSAGDFTGAVTDGSTHLPLSNQQSKTSVTLLSTPLPWVEGMVMSSTLQGRERRRGEERGHAMARSCKSTVSDSCCKQIYASRGLWCIEHSAHLTALYQ